ncbi:MAG: ribosome recycling factor [Bacillota bacterium]|nr:ribosome recycling factor [Bacillota bacterium]
MKEILKDTEDQMRKTAEVFRKELAGVRAGRANPALLEKVIVQYYGVPTPVNQLATIAVPEPRLLVIQPWDKTQLGNIEKAIMKSDLGIMPTSDSNVIRLVIPQLTQERRQDIVKTVRKKAEEERVAVRNHRRDANELLESLEDDREISEDEYHRALEEVQKLTDKYVKELERVLELKEKEIMEV